MKARFEPGEQAGFGALQGHVSDADLGESQRFGALQQSRNDLLPDDLLGPRGLLILNHPPILETRRLHWPDEAACAHFAQALAAQPDIVHARLELHGPLGAGKTTFVRHLLRALGVRGRIKSPTYTVMEPYRVTGPSGQPLDIAHFDFYRFTDPREWEDAGFRDVFAQPGLCLSEWADKAHPWLPPPDVSLHIILQSDDTRELHLCAHSPIGQRLLTLP